jgi:hypothetical protein
MKIDQIKFIKIFSNDKILSEDSAITYLTKSNGLDEPTVINAGNTLIKDRKLITATDRHNKLHLRKNPYSLYIFKGFFIIFRIFFLFFPKQFTKYITEHSNIIYFIILFYVIVFLFNYIVGMCKGGSSNPASIFSSKLLCVSYFIS